MVRVFVSVIGCAVWFLSALPSWSAESKPDAAGVAFFEKKIRPVLVRHCYMCHSAKSKKVKGSLLLDTRAGMRKGGDTGPAVVPKQPAKSVLLEALRYDGLEMPPKGKLPQAIIADFEKWVQMGAPDPRSQDEVKRMKDDNKNSHLSKHWSFRPIQRPAVPKVQDKMWPLTPIDRFILSRLESQDLAPVETASKRTLIRRVYFDLIGLPPTPAEIDQFMTDESPNALTKTVDRLLESRHFGERWGRHWLDVSRFAESSGGGRTRIFHEAWRFRDYVFDSLNADKPFNQFITEQIAGDLLPFKNRRQRTEQLTATSFLALGPINYELQDKELLRMEVVDEQLETVGRTFLGMTVGCARCHDHKFDPIPTRDYYALAGIFRNTKTLITANVSNPVMRALPVSELRQQELDRHAQTLKAAEEHIKQAKVQVQSLDKRLAGGGEALTDLSKLAGIVVDDTQAVLVGNWKHSTFTSGYVGKGYIHDLNTEKGSKSATFVPDLPQAGLYEVRVAYTASSNRATNAPFTVRHAGGEQTLAVDQKRKPPVAGTFLSLGRFRFEKGKQGSVVVSNQGTTGHVIADAVQFLPLKVASSHRDSKVSTAQPTKRPSQPKQEETALKQQLKQARTDLKRLETALKALKKKAPTPAPSVMSVQEEDVIEDYYILIRGNIRNLGDKVPRGFLSAASAGRSSRISNKESGRRELAEWIASPDNPLTARVIVNRIWHHLFGAGIVRTVDNFGTTGEPPSHPLLLDWLAGQFVEDGWSVKKAVRRIVLSKVYRLASRKNDRGTAIDLDNRLLWRMNRRRLDAESIRDSILSVSRQLDLRYGGATIPASTTSEFGYQFTSLRRSVYVPVFRNRLHELFEVFDFANPNFVAGRRSTSTLPTQALYLMNSPFVMEQARQAARSLLEVPKLTTAERIDLAYRRALGRRPSNLERKLVLEYIGDAGSDAADDRTIRAWSNLHHVLFACIDFRYLN